MTLALYGKSRKRQGGLLLAALLAMLGAAIGGLVLVSTAFAHHIVPSVTTPTCQNQNWAVNVSTGQWDNYREAVLTGSPGPVTLAFSPFVYRGPDRSILSNNSGTGNIVSSGTVTQYSGSFGNGEDLDEDVDTSETNILINNSLDAAYVVGGVIKIDNELMKITGVDTSGQDSLDVTRGFGGTTPATHNDVSNTDEVTVWTRDANEEPGHTAQNPHHFSWNLSFSTTSCAPATGSIIVKKVKDPAAPAADASLFNGTIDAAGDWGASGIGFGASYTKTGLSAGSHNVKETSTQNAWTLVGYKVVDGGNGDTVCSTTKADYTNPTPATGIAATVVANHSVVVCVMNTKTQEVVTKTCQDFGYQSFAAIISGQSGSGVMTNPATYDYTGPTAPVGADGLAIDHKWAHVTSNGFMVYDLGVGNASKDFYLYPSIDHDPVPGESREAGVYGSNSAVGPWTTLLTYTAVGAPSDPSVWISDDGPSHWTSAVAYRYIAVHPDSVNAQAGVLILSDDAEIDAVCAGSFVQDQTPTVAKAPADLEPNTQGTQSYANGKAYYTITITNPNAGSQTVQVTDGGATLESTVYANACNPASGAGPWTCSASGTGTGAGVTTLLVSRPASEAQNNDGCVVINPEASATWYDVTGAPHAITVTGVPTRAYVPSSLCQGFIQVHKIVTNVASDPTDFDFSFANPATNFTVKDDQSSGDKPANLGAQVVTEAAETGYTQLGWATIFGGTQCPAAMPTSVTGNVIAFGTDATAEVTVTSNNTNVICFYNEAQSVTIKATKIVCDQESDLPPFQLAGLPVSATTATTFLASHPNCHAESGWDFEWGYGQAPGSVAQKQPGNTIGLAGAGQGWNIFTGGDSATFKTASVPSIAGHTGSDGLWVRESLKAGYLPFTDDASPNASFSAELGCHLDAINYDNYDSIDNPAAGGIYYCVAWNVKVRNVTIEKVVPDVANDPTEFPIGQDALADSIGSISELSPLSVVVDTGAHVFTETVTPPYTIMGWRIIASTATCQGTNPPTAGEVQPNVAGLDATAEIAAGEGAVKICFYNDPFGTVIVHKVYAGPTPSPETTFSGGLSPNGGGAYNFSGLNAANPQTINNVAAGSYGIVEAPETGYEFVGSSVNDGGEGACGSSPAAGAAVPNFLPPSFQVTGGSTTDVYLCNQPMGTVVIEKNETHATAGSETWNFTSTAPVVGNPSLITAANADASTSSNSTQILNVPVGSYTITETEGRGLCVSGSTASDYQTEAAAAFDNDPSAADTVPAVGVVFSVAPGRTTYIRFDNVGCGTVLTTSTIIVQKYSDFNGDFAVNGTDAPIAGWDISISGPGIIGTQTQQTDAGGQTVFVGLTGGTYTITEANGAPSYVVVGSNQGAVNTAGVTASVSLGLDETRTVVFHNRPVVRINLHKNVQTGVTTTNGAGWTFTLTGCGIASQSATTDASGNASFINLPPAIGCSYTVTETQQAGYFALNPVQTTSPTDPNVPASLGFTNVRNDAVCVTNCGQTVPTPTPTTAPPTATPTAINTVQGEKTPGPTATSTATTPPKPPVGAVEGEKTPGPPQTGSGLGSQAGSINVFLAVLGLLVLSAGLTLVALGRGKNRA